MSALTVRLIIVFLWLPLAFMATEAQQVTDLVVYHRYGQTFLKWKTGGPSVTGYTVYRSRRPLRTALALAQAEEVYRVRPGQAIDRRMSAITGLPRYFRFPGPAGRLASHDECLVLATTQSATSYYAVTLTDRKGEHRQLRPGRNATLSGVRERTGSPRPVFQDKFIRDGRSADVFVHWASNTDAVDYPAMVNVPSHPFHFAVRKNGRAPIHPLLLRMHGRGGHFLSDTEGSGNPQEYILLLDDHLPGHAYSTFWFGYNMGIDIFGRMTPAPDGAAVMDYTRRRVLWTLRWVLREMPVDSTRVYLCGTSMGGSGAFFTALAATRDIAGVLSVLPRLDYAARDTIETPYGRGAYAAGDALWGRPALFPSMFSGDRVYELLDGSHSLRTMEASDIPHIRIVAGRRDSVVGWRQLAQVLRTADSLGAGIAAFWDERGHGSTGPFVWTPQEDAALLYRYRTDRSWPSFSSVSTNNSPSDTASRGMMNAAADWFEPVVDLPDLWSVGLRRTTLAMGDSVIRISGPVSVTITPRKLQRFRIRSGAWYRCEVLDGVRSLYSAVIQAQKNGVLSFSSVPLPEQPVRFEIRPVAGAPSPAR
jgi:hypothetical protein